MLQQARKKIVDNFRLDKSIGYKGYDITWDLCDVMLEKRIITIYPALLNDKFDKLVSN